MLATQLYRAPSNKADVDIAVAAAYEKADALVEWSKPYTPDAVRAYGDHSHTRYLDDPAVTVIELWRRERPTHPYPFNEAEVA